MSLPFVPRWDWQTLVTLVTLLSVLADTCQLAAAEIERLAAIERPWLPISSAPRDGTRLELWITIGPRPYAIYGVYLEHGEAWYSDSGVVLNTPTHYRREPAGPESKPDQETKGER